MTISHLLELFTANPYLVYGIIILIFLLAIVCLYMLEARCPDIINCTQSMANALVEGITNSFSSFDSRGMNELVPSNDPVWILGVKYSSLHDMDGIKDDLRSKLWISYRKGFPRIDGTGPTSDSGWGCMLRCGQMVYGQALVMKHLGRHWRWSSDNKDLIKNGTYRKYLKILSHFLDRKGSLYSIHQISQMGATEGNPVGTWFGPNAICQVLKKLSEYDKENKCVVHICNDNLVIIDEIKNTVRTAISQDEQSQGEKWHDVILFIPLRLGIADSHPDYFEGIKNSFRLSQSLGIIGGRPNHALHFIGYVGDELIYFDPHTTQNVVDPEPLVDIDNVSDSELININFDDSSYHTENAARLSFNQLDPSLAMCFYFKSEEDFDSWCNLAHSLFEKNVPIHLFEVFKEKPYRSLRFSSSDWSIEQEGYDCGTLNSLSAEPSGSRKPLISPAKEMTESGEKERTTKDLNEVEEKDDEEDFEILSTE